MDSPPVSPEEENIGYSPVERFSDDESSDASSAASSFNARQKPACTPAAAVAASRETHPVPSTSQSQSHTQSQAASTTTLPPEEPPPAKKPRAAKSYKSIFSPTYEGSAAAAAFPGTNCIKIGLPGKSILYFQENMTSRRPWSRLRCKILLP